MRRRVMISLIAAFLLLGLIIGGFMSQRESPERSPPQVPYLQEAKVLYKNGNFLKAKEVLKLAREKTDDVDSLVQIQGLLEGL